MDFDLLVPENAYIFGFMQADGHFSENTRNRGRITIELSLRDKELLDKFAVLLPVRTTQSERTRDTNFKKNNTTCQLNIYDWEFRELLKSYGLTPGKKSHNIDTPLVPYSEVDYFRGLIDGDGSLGVTSLNKPFVCLGTSSEPMATAFRSFVFKHTNRMLGTTRNKRDNYYNLMIALEAAQHLSSVLYYQDCLCLARKQKLAADVAAWVRPDTCKRRAA